MAIALWAIGATWIGAIAFNGSMSLWTGSAGVDAAATVRSDGAFAAGRRIERTSDVPTLDDGFDASRLLPWTTTGAEGGAAWATDVGF